MEVSRTSSISEGSFFPAKLKFYRSLLSEDLRASLTSSLIFPLLDYCCLVYHDLIAELNLKLERLINFCIRFVFDLRRDVHITPYRRRLGWLTVKSRRLYFLGIAIFNISRSKAPRYILDLFTRSAIDRDHPLRRPPSMFVIPSHRTSAYRHSFSLSLPHTFGSHYLARLLAPHLWFYLSLVSLLIYSHRTLTLKSRERAVGAFSSTVLFSLVFILVYSSF